MLPENFSLDNLGGEFAALKNAVLSGRDTAVFFAERNARAHLTSGLGRFFLYIAQDRVAARAAAELMSEYTGKEVVFIPEKEDVLINTQAVLTGSLYERISALQKILSGEVAGATIGPEMLLRYLPPVSAFKEAALELKKDSSYDVYALVEKLSLGGYKREEIAEEKGSYSLRGDILDIFPSNTELPVRCEFFGDRLESLRLYAPDSLTSVKEIESVSIAPRSDILLSKEDKEIILKRLSAFKKIPTAASSRC
jgi:Transcription-repair coupling factor (superfamily II helicase)